MTSWSELPLTEEHAAYLRDEAGISPVVAAATGIRSASTIGELPDWAQSWGEQAVPAIVFPWKTIHGEVIEQVRPDTEVQYDGKRYKYLFPKGSGAVLNALRHDPGAERVLIVEGTKQGLAAASWAPEDVAVYGVGGCRNWSTDGIPDTDLLVCDGKQVFILLDADVTSNRDVYDAAMKLRRAAKQENAKSVAYCILPAGGTNGLDDVIGKRPEDKRTSYIEGLMREAVAKEKPCSKAPDAKPKKRAISSDAQPVTAGDGTERPVIYVDGDRWEVINDITTRLLNRWDATRLFCHGEVLSQLIDEGEGPKMRPLTEVDGTFYDVLQETAATAKKVLDNEGNQIGVAYTWPDGQTVKAARSRASRFAKLEVISRSPFIRVDGSICQCNGYDEASKTMVVMDESLADLDVPENPTREQVDAAVSLILDEWLGDFPFPDQENRANALALVLTPFVRALMDVVPLAVIDAHTPGTGKNLLVDSILMLFLGERPQLLPFNQDDDEFRKTLTSAFREGSEVLVFDEAHHLEGVSLARALTASHWKDRGLGGNQMLGFPNRATWISLGNNVRVEGDIFRRVYRVALRSPYADPSAIPEDQYKHPDLKQWTQENRPALLRAALTIVRAWFAEGQPKPTRSVAFGGFEKFARVLGGILQVAGVEGFLGNLSAWRSESNFSSGYWESHLMWLSETFVDRDFTASDVRYEMTKFGADPAFPPLGRNVDPEDKANYPKALGEAYAKQRERWYGGLRLLRPVDVDGKPRRDGTGRAIWVISKAEGGQDDPMCPTSENGPHTPETSETSETVSTFVGTEKILFSTDDTDNSEKKISACTDGSAEGLGGLGGLSPDLDGGLFPRSDTSGTPAETRPEHVPTPPVYGGDSRPADWVALFGVDTPELAMPTCDTCGTEKVPDAEMAYFLLCPRCTPGSLRPADSEVAR